MATVVLAAAGAAIGGTLGGGVAGVSAIALGRLVGASAGRLVDQRILGSGAKTVETGRVDRFRISGSAEGATQSRVFGRMRLAGQVIWASRFEETQSVSGGGKGAPAKPKTRTYSYSVSMALALCEGEIQRVGRIWADGNEVSPDDLNMRVYKGDMDQQPDPKMEAIEGAGAVPSYRGTAYVVLEDLPLEQFGNRVPQFSFEVIRGTPQDVGDADSDMARSVSAVALMPGSGEYALATTPVRIRGDVAEFRTVNEHSPSGKTDFVTSVDALRDELPNCGAASLVVSWFGDDLRVGECQLRPKVEQKDADAMEMPWRVSGLTRESAQQIPRKDGIPVYGGTPCDQSVRDAIRHLQGNGLQVMFYPFILMEQLEGNGLPDPWDGADNQPVLPWRGRITLSAAHGRDGSPSGSEAADQEVVSFFGTASAADFTVGEDSVEYNGPEEWSYRRFILHNAALCASAGGVDAFCIGSEMRGLTQIIGQHGFPAVQALITLAAEVRQVLGAETKIGYAADWSEYFGYQPDDGSGDVYFHLDPLWSDANIDFVGIDNYMPLSDWRDGKDHIDAADWRSIYDPEYLKANIEGGEGYDWYYHSEEARFAQRRTAISDGTHDEPWVFRYKDIRNWWSHSHHDRIGGIRSAESTPWVPGSKPIWFTEIGCGAINKGTNQPNKFVDPKSSESSVPWFSNGARDDFLQQRYLQVMRSYWEDEENNPVSAEYQGRMIDVSRMYVWAWDTRPFPSFPNNTTDWNDGENYKTGHWITGRSSNRTLESVVSEICERSGMMHFDASQLEGVVRGYVEENVADARAMLQPLMLCHGFDAVERDGVLNFVMRGRNEIVALERNQLAVAGDLDAVVEKTREAQGLETGRVRLGFIEAGSDFATVFEEAILPDEATNAVSFSEFPISMSRSEGRLVAERWIAEAAQAKESIRLALPPSKFGLGAGDVISISSEDGVENPFRIDHVDLGEMQIVDATTIEQTLYQVPMLDDDLPHSSVFVPPTPALTLFLDLPLMTGDEVPHAPHVAVTGKPWTGAVAVHESSVDANYRLNTLVNSRSTIGVTQTAMFAARPGLLDRGDGLQVKLTSGALESIPLEQLLSGGNLAAIGDGSTDNWEVFQFQVAELIDTDTFRLSGRLRGQLGSDVRMPDVWPAGSWFVMLDGNPRQLDLPTSSRNVVHHYRVGPAGRSMEDSSYSHHIRAFSGNGLKPYAPVHLHCATNANGEKSFSWIRRTRIMGDGWDGLEVPLGEEIESYLVRVLKDNRVVREDVISSPKWVYSIADQSVDGCTGGFTFQVAQISAHFGAGGFGSLGVE